MRSEGIAAGCGAGLLVLLMASVLVSAQAPELEPNHPQHPRVPTVTFSFHWPSIQPHDYVISVDSSGDAAYQSWMAEPTAEQSINGDPYMVKFTVSAATRDRMFVLARQLNYFNGDFEFHKHRVAWTGDKTLAYADPDKQYQTTYNWSENPGIEQLTELFQGISATIESGRRLERLYHFDPLGLDEELKNLERLVLDHRAVELQVIEPTLQKIADDYRVMNIARQRARHVLQIAGVSQGANAEASRK
jgi:hypothetical protein